MAISLSVLSLTSCKDFLTYAPSNQRDTEKAIETVADMDVAMNGVYYLMGRYEFLGRNAIAIGDISTDNAYMIGGSGHFDDIYLYNYTESSEVLEGIWARGYEVINATTNLVKKGGAVASGNLSAGDKTKAKGVLGQAYAARAISNFYLVNIFATTYNGQAASNNGIILVKDPIPPFTEVTRGSVKETYDFILDDLKKASELMDPANDDNFTLTLDAVNAFEARVRLYMGDYQGAIAAANKVLGAKRYSLEMDPAAYRAMWNKIELTSEDIFTIGKQADDNLSANALNTLYDTYKGRIDDNLIALFDKEDMRYTLFEKDEQKTWKGLKYQGLPSSKATSNIPIVRLPEIYLILAEAYAQTGNTVAAVDNLFEVAKRNPNLSKGAIPTNKDGLLSFIADERRRELFQEGHRLFDARRTGDLMTRGTGRAIFENWNASSFVYPIPNGEVNASGLAQNENWTTVRPTLKK